MNAPPLGATHRWTSGIAQTRTCSDCGLADPWDMAEQRGDLIRMRDRQGRNCGFSFRDAMIEARLLAAAICLGSIAATANSVEANAGPRALAA